MKMKFKLFTILLLFFISMVGILAFITEPKKHGSFIELGNLPSNTAFRNGFTLDKSSVFIGNYIYNFQENKYTKIKIDSFLITNSKQLLLPTKKILLIQKNGYLIYDPFLQKFTQQVKKEFLKGANISDALMIDNNNVLILNSGNIALINIQKGNIRQSLKLPFSTSSEPQGILLSNNRVIILSEEKEIFFYNLTSNTIQRSAAVKDIYIPIPLKLADDNILLAKKQSDNKEIEIFYSTSDKLVRVGQLNYEGYSTATLLQNGTVLFTGGKVPSLSWYLTPFGCESFQNGAEVFDPITRIAHIVGKLKKARYGHTAMLLPHGKVLIIGGMDVSSCDSGDHLDIGTSSVELYIPKERI